jgi:ATP-dependent exoDNAse (exonuclease V) alpha subunit
VLYVGMSRARDKLVVVASKEIILNIKGMKIEK